MERMETKINSVTSVNALLVLSDEIDALVHKSLKEDETMVKSAKNGLSLFDDLIVAALKKGIQTSFIGSSAIWDLMANIAIKTNKALKINDEKIPVQLYPKGNNKFQVILGFPVTEDTRYVLTRIEPLMQYIDNALIKPMISENWFAVDKQEGKFYKLKKEEYESCLEKSICEVENMIEYELRDYKCGLGNQGVLGSKLICPGELMAYGSNAAIYKIIKGHLIFSHHHQDASRLVRVHCGYGTKDPKHPENLILTGRGHLKLIPGCEYVFKSKGGVITAKTKGTPFRWNNGQIEDINFSIEFYQFEQYEDDLLEVIEPIGGSMDEMNIRLQQVQQEHVDSTNKVLAQVKPVEENVGSLKRVLDGFIDDQGELNDEFEVESLESIISGRFSVGTILLLLSILLAVAIYRKCRSRGERQVKLVSKKSYVSADRVDLDISKDNAGIHDKNVSSTELKILNNRAGKRNPKHRDDTNGYSSSGSDF